MIRVCSRLLPSAFGFSVIPAYYSYKERKKQLDKELDISLEDIRKKIIKHSTHDEYIKANAEWSYRISIINESYAWADLTNCLSTAYTMMNIIPRLFYHHSGKKLKYEQKWPSYQLWQHAQVTPWLERNDHAIILINSSGFTATKKVFMKKDKELKWQGHAVILWKKGNEFFRISTHHDERTLDDGKSIVVRSNVVKDLKKLEECNFWSESKKFDSNFLESLSLVYRCTNALNFSGRPQFRFYRMSLRQPYRYRHPWNVYFKNQF